MSLNLVFISLFIQPSWFLGANSIICPTGTQLVGNNCEPIVCATGTQLVGNDCEPIICATGKELVGNNCQDISCATGFEFLEEFILFYKQFACLLYW